MTLAVALNILVAILLAVAIVAAAMLNRRFAAFRNAKAEFEQVIERFNLAAARAEGGVNGLRASADTAGSALQQSIARAQALRGDFAALIERAERSAAALNDATRANAVAPVTPPVEPVRPLRAVKPAPVAVTADTDLLKSLSSLR